MTDFYLDPQSFSIPGLRDIDKEWSNIPDTRIKSMIVVESQYLAFHKYLLDSLCFQWRDSNGKVIVGKLDHSVRAGAIKAAVLVSASIVEAALRAHAEQRKYDLPKNERHRTFGALVEAWEKSGARDFAAVWDDVKTLKDHRNTIHLYKAADEKMDFREVLAAEEGLLGSGNRAIDAMKKLTS